MIEEGKNKELNTNVNINVSEEKIIIQAENSNSTIKWDLVEKIVTYNDYIFIYISAIKAIIIPKKYFKNGETFLAFHELLMKYKSMDLS